MSGGGDLTALESSQAQYKTMMTGAAGGQQLQRYGVSRPRASQALGQGQDLNTLWQQYGTAGLGQRQQQSTFASRKGGVAGAGAGAGSLNTAAAANLNNQFVSYDYDYDYGGAAGGLGGAGAGNRRFGQYGNYDYSNYGGLGAGAGALNRGYGGGSGLGVGYGGYSPVSVVSGYGPGVCEDKGLNPALVLATLAGAGLAFFIIYRQITTGGKRNLNPSVTEFLDHAASLLWSGE